MWPEGRTLNEKLRGGRAALERTAAFVRAAAYWSHAVTASTWQQGQGRRLILGHTSLCLPTRVCINKSRLGLLSLSCKSHGPLETRPVGRFDTALIRVALHPGL